MSCRGLGEPDCYGRGGKRIFFLDLATETFKKQPYHESSVEETLRISIIYDKMVTNGRGTCTLTPTIKKDVQELFQTPEQVKLAYIVTRSGSPPKAAMCFWIHFNAKRSMADQQCYDIMASNVRTISKTCISDSCSLRFLSSQESKS